MVLRMKAARLHEARLENFAATARRRRARARARGAPPPAVASCAHAGFSALGMMHIESQRQKEAGEGEHALHYTVC